MIGTPSALGRHHMLEHVKPSSTGFETDSNLMYFVRHELKIKL
jgi:hypothetical protein